MSDELLRDVLARVKRIEEAVFKQATIKAAYTVNEFAKLVDLEPDTVREHCRLRRLNATKRLTGRGNHCEWSLSHDELIRYQTEGLLPLKLVS